ncbi:Methylmalonyl-CoA epimerase, mitochondrial [Myotis davidii]|uniref:Methylmalonyl-CoA epimerase, mitochondrial n=1 Tax=Myotis davidii TaxID=225400 RepID=L5LD92_MYODS|nr:Methylmalonyl-CoA epimerase, mitochondrial [Myotis davidii]
MVKMLRCRGCSPREILQLLSPLEQEPVDDINAAVMDLKEKKIRSLSDEAKIGAHGKPVIFLHPKDCGGVLVELEQA